MVNQIDGDFGGGEIDCWAIGTTTGTGAVHDRLRAVIRNPTDTAFIQNTVDVGFATNEPFLASYINGGTGGFRFNGTLATFPAAGLHASETKPLNLFAQANANNLDATNFWDGDICEIIIYNSALSDANRTLVENYLLAKWGIT